MLSNLSRRSRFPPALRCRASTEIRGKLPRAARFWGYFWGKAETSPARTGVFSVTYGPKPRPSAPPINAAISATYKIWWHAGGTAMQHKREPRNTVPVGLVPWTHDAVAARVGLRNRGAVRGEFRDHRPSDQVPARRMWKHRPPVLLRRQHAEIEDLVEVVGLLNTVRNAVHVHQDRSDRQILARDQRVNLLLYFLHDGR
jgi:hypothetical protein